MFDTIDEGDYYEPILANSSFDGNFELYEIRSDKDKNHTLKEYIHTITPYLFDLINEKKNGTKEEQKVQLILSIIFKHITDISKRHNVYVKSRNITMRYKWYSY